MHGSGTKKEKSRRETHLRGGADRLLHPLGAVEVRLVHHRQRRDVCRTMISYLGRERAKGNKKRTRVKVVREEVVVALADRIEQRFIHVRVAKEARGDLVKHVRERRALLLDRDGVVRVLVPEVLDGSGGAARSAPSSILGSGRGLTESSARRRLDIEDQWGAVHIARNSDTHKRCSPQPPPQSRCSRRLHPSVFAV
jgi:hypothetical protein